MNWVGLAKIAQWILGTPMSLSLPITIYIFGAIIGGFIKGAKA
jgi:hypothetical protein